MSTEDFVDQLYRNFLYREPDEAGKADWVNRINSAEMSSINVTASFMRSAEYKQKVDSISKLYFMFFGRIPDQAGMEYWQAQLDAGQSLVDITNAFSQSQEYHNNYGTDSDSEFIDIFYARVFNRLPDDAGKQTWLDKLASGTGRVDLFTQMSSSYEFINDVYPKIWASSVFYGVLGRLPTDTEIYETLNSPDLLSGYYERNGLIEQLYNSSEYQGVLPPARFTVNNSYNSIQLSEEDGAIETTITRQGYTQNTVEVQYQVQTGKAEAGADFTGGSGILTFEPGETSKTISIDIIDDSTVEPDEDFAVQFTADGGLPLDAPTLSFLIRQNDRRAPVQVEDLPTQNLVTFQGNGDIGRAVSAAGDLNGDGFDDFLLDNGQWLVFGHGGSWDSVITSDQLSDATNIIALEGGTSITSPAGDVNGDGFDDLIIGKPGGSPENRQYAGESYLIFGHAGGWGPSLDVSNLEAERGITIVGTTAGDESGATVAGGGDFNGDGFDDLLIGTPEGLDPGDNTIAHGLVYVVFGHGGDWQSSLELSDIQGATGYAIAGLNNRGLGTTIANVDDVNGDGLDDLFISEHREYLDASPAYGYLVFGQSDGWQSGLDLGNLSLEQGVAFLLPNPATEVNVASTGDFNNDGLTDFVIASPYDDFHTGRNFVVYGKQDGWESQVILDEFGATNGSIIHGAYRIDHSGIEIASIGDTNNDGFDDLFIVNSTGGYLLYGQQSGWDAEFELYTLTPEYGERFQFNDDHNNTYNLNVSSAGDVNQDGFSDFLLTDTYGNNNSGAAYLIFGSDQLIA